MALVRLVKYGAKSAVTECSAAVVGQLEMGRRPLGQLDCVDGCCAPRRSTPAEVKLVPCNARATAVVLMSGRVIVLVVARASAAARRALATRRWW